MSANVTISKRARGTGSWQVRNPSDTHTMLEVTPGAVLLGAVTAVLIEDDVPDDASTALILAHHVVGEAPVAGVGVEVIAEAQNEAGDECEIASVRFVLESVEEGSEAGEISIKLQQGGETGLVEVARLKRSGELILTGRIAAAGGYRKPVGPFTTTASADQTNVEASFGGFIGGGYVVTRAGSLVGISGQLSLALSGAPITVKAYVNGVDSGLHLTFAAGSVRVRSVTSPVGDIPLAVDDLVTLVWSSGTITSAPKLALTVEVEG